VKKMDRETWLDMWMRSRLRLKCQGPKRGFCDSKTRCKTGLTAVKVFCGNFCLFWEQFNVFLIG